MTGKKHYDTASMTESCNHMKNIVLVGFMGTGKTAVAKRLAHELKMKYIATDDIIEKREKKPVNDIFANDGEPYFRKVEKEVVENVSSMSGVVVATGGGVVLDNENMENLRKNGVVISLNATPEEILERTKSYAHRPLLNVPDPLGKIKELLKERAPYYEKADYQVDTSGKALKGIVEEVKGIISKL